ncbi:hypothetical protein BOX15_Mlig006180g1 [Macrostomum lignano]|uniref:Transposable element P transposase n=1 Tax=Macrostomum lignano TaxID=282301 RepID=A0A267DBB7_9PLAT|nr:hypothetical protein BOX15_Mlig006180g1 [Macrostomum lignano]
MKVSLAAQVFSHSVASGMRVLVDHDRMEKSALQTAEFVEKVNEMFDILNSASLFGKHGKGAVTEESAETVLSQLSAAQEFILTWRFSPVRGGRSKTTMPFKEGWLLSIESAKRIIHFGLREAGVSYLCLRRFSQDHVENFFSMVRGRNGFNEKPNCMRFSVHFDPSVLAKWNASLRTAQTVRTMVMPWQLRFVTYVRRSRLHQLQLQSSPSSIGQFLQMETLQQKLHLTMWRLLK